MEGSRVTIDRSWFVPPVSAPSIASPAEGHHERDTDPFHRGVPPLLDDLEVPAGYSGQNVRLQALRQEIPPLAPDFPMTPGSSEFAAGGVGLPAADADRISLNCPQCGAGLNVRKAYAGQNVRCGQCGQKFPVPSRKPPGRRAGPGRAADPGV